MAIAIITTFRQSLGEGLRSYLLAALCFLLYLIRRNKRMNESGKKSDK
jgi:hypothetical protein